MVNKTKKLGDIGLNDCDSEVLAIGMLWFGGKTYGELSNNDLIQAAEALALEGFKLLWTLELVNCDHWFFSYNKRWEFSQFTECGAYETNKGFYPVIIRAQTGANNLSEEKVHKQELNEGDLMLKFFGTPAGRWKGIKETG